MKPFTFYHSFIDSFSFQQEKLASIIVDIAQPDVIYLLGASLYRRRSESIFCTTAPSSHHTADYILLILIKDLAGKQIYEWQDKIEQYCKAVMPVTTIILQTGTFQEWLKTNHPFAHTVYQSAVPIYDSGNLPLPAHIDNHNKEDRKELESQCKEGLKNATEFLAGADLYRIREQNKLAAFMLHQSVEQALRTILKIGTGFHSNTHSIERLIRYASMVSYQLPDVFPQKTDADKQLFHLLQRAYSDTRYKHNYHISTPELLSLSEKARRITEILSAISGTMFN